MSKAKKLDKQKKKKLNMLKSKKGGIPAINEIVMTFLNITPKPILLLMFILLITTISGFIIPTMLSMVGYECVERNNQLLLYQIPNSVLGGTIFVDIERGLEGILGIQPFKLPDDPFPDGNKEFLRIPDQCFVQDTINSSRVVGYSAQCVNCPIDAFLGLALRNNKICVGDGTKNFVVGSKTKFCSQCAPPEPYYYNHTNCQNADECFFTITDTSLIPNISSTYFTDTSYNRVIELGGVLRPQDNAQIVNIQCSSSAKPNLFFFSIELFNRTMWILLLIGYALVMFAWGWYAVALN